MIKTLTVVAIILASLSTSSASSADALADSNYTLEDGFPINNIDGRTFGRIAGIVVDANSNIIIFHQGANKSRVSPFRTTNHHSRDSDRQPAISENTVITIDPNELEIVREWGKDLFYLPQDISLDYKGENLWLVDIESRQVFKYSLDGSAKLLELGSAFSCGNICKPTSVADNGEFVFVADSHTNQIVIFTWQGEYLSPVDRSSSHSSVSQSQLEFKNLHKLVYAKEAKLLCAADRTNATIQCFTFDSLEYYKHGQRLSRALKLNYTIGHPQFKGIQSSMDYSPNGGGIMVALASVLPSSPNGKILGRVHNATSGQFVSEFSLPSKSFGSFSDLAITGRQAESIYVVGDSPVNIWRFSRSVRDDQLNEITGAANKTTANNSNNLRVKCGETISQNGRVFVNSLYPYAQVKTDICQVTIAKQPNVCQLRLDFEKFSLAQPDENGLCTIDSFMVLTTVGERLPIICGENSGQHMYVSMRGRNANSVKLLVVPNSNLQVRKWKIRVNMIPCDSIELAPTGCLQFYRSRWAVVRSFNYGPATEGRARYPPNLHYTSCIRVDEDSCAIKWTPEQPNSFSFGTPSRGNSTDQIGSTGRKCDGDDFIGIDQGSEDGIGAGEEKFCGTKLLQSNVVISRSQPFQLKVRSDANHEENALNSQVGFSLRYIQLPCAG